jgi:hypothetical protein
MQKYGIKNQFSVESFFIRRPRRGDWRNFSNFFHFFHAKKTMDGEKRVENYP